MTSNIILESLAHEFSVAPEHIRNTLEMIDAGLGAPYIGRVRRTESGQMSESLIRRIDRRRQELVELDRRRGTILRMIDAQGDVPAETRGRIERCVERFDLEDLFVPHRRPEPEVQLAFDRGLGKLADALMTQVPKSERPAKGDDKKDAGDTSSDASGAPDVAAEAEVVLTPTAAPEAQAPEGGAADPATADTTATSEVEAPATETGSVEDSEPDVNSETESATATTPAAEAAADTEKDTSAEVAADAPVANEGGGTEAGETPATETAATETETPETGDTPAEAAPASSEGSAPNPEAGASSDGASEVGASEVGASEEGASEEGASGEGAKRGKRKAPPVTAPAPSPVDEGPAVELTPELARVCAPFVNPDRGVHTEAEALAGAMRILSDRLGRDTRLRGLVRRMIRKNGILSVRQIVDDKKLGRHRSLLKLRQPLRQLQGHRLLSLRQAQKERVLNTIIELDPKPAFPKVRNSMGKFTVPESRPVLDLVAKNALVKRLIPVLEADVRLELKERADDEALRFLAQHLRQVLLTPPMGPHPAGGLDVNAKGDWTLALVGADGAPLGPATRIETSEKDAAALGEELKAALGEHGVRVIAMGHGKGARVGLAKVREALAAAQVEVFVAIVNEAGLSSYANSEVARKELADRTVPDRMATSLARRLQDPMVEILKVDPRHLGLGSEQGLVSKANLKRVYRETIESCVAHIGCDVNTAPKSFLRNIPALDAEVVDKLIERREQAPFTSREELRSEGLLNESQWTSSVLFLRVPNSTEPLDRTSLHPQQYELARTVVASTGGTVEESLGRQGITRGLRREDYGADDMTWRDVMRELSAPARDPRMRWFLPRVLSPNADPVTITKDRVVEGVVSNVTSFGAFVDIGLKNDGMIHISEISDRYVRDARELLSIGQPVRVRILDPNGQRVSLSLKGIGGPEGGRRGGGGGGARRSGGQGGGGRRERGGGGGGGGRRDRRDSPPGPPIRAAQSRRDGLGGTGGGGRGRGGQGGRPRPGGGGRGGGRDRQGRDREERFDPKDLRTADSNAGKYNPFASFFDDDASAKEPTSDKE